jgi:endonuclease/exonuclease/phosphatase family metal-dependent hydrolase
MMRTRSHLARLARGVSGLLAVLAIASARPVSGAPDAAATGPAIALDGVVQEWPRGVHAVADAEFLCFRLPFDELRNLLTAGKPVLIALDLDADASTGVERAGMGVDFEISLRHRESWRDPWFFATRFEGGRVMPVAFEALEPVAQPTCAAEAFELRIRRDADAALMDATRARGVIELTDARTVRNGRDERLEDVAIPFEVALPRGTGVRPVEATLPPTPAGAVRVVSHNVLWSSPEKDPAPFARMYRALDPDVYLIQEWGRGRWSDAYEDELEAWFTAHVDPDRVWRAVRCEGWGVAVVTHHPVLERGPTEMRAETLTRWDFPVRFAGAVVRTPAAVLAVGSVHLKAGGELGSAEDQRRLDEAREIRGIMGLLASDAARAAGDLPVWTVLGGDFNHNGHPLVLDHPIGALDADGSGLTFAFTRVLGTRSRYSFGGPAHGHGRSFLDYIAYPDAAARVANAFVLDTEILSDASLGAMGLERGDSSGSDHLPVVVDLVPAE